MNPTVSQKKAVQEDEIQGKKESEDACATRKSIHREVDKVENSISVAKSGISNYRHKVIWKKLWKIKAKALKGSW